MITHEATGLNEYTVTDHQGKKHKVYGTDTQDAYRNMLKLRDELNKSSVEGDWLNDWPRCKKCGLLHPVECK